ncbi:MAG TPA: hypothetical protein VFR02_01045, partial [bacterium]|nr:hypothetical protein [bacterium]
VDAGHAGRSLGATPFVALTAGLLLEALWRRAKGKLSLVFGAALLAFIGWQNWHDYFKVQTRDPACRNDCSWAESRVGELVARDGGATEFFLTSRFEGHPTVLYLAGGKASQCQPLDPSALPAPQDRRPGGAFCFLLGGDAGGMLEYLKACYPGGEVGSRENPLGETALIGYRVGPQALAKLGKARPGSGRGLLGSYAHLDASGEKPFLMRLDPVLNFGFRDLPGTGSALFIHWRGTFHAARAGDYEWVAVTAGYGRARLQVDGKSVDFTEDPRLSVELAPGPHRLDLWYRQPATPLSELHLLWRPPETGGLVFVPNGVWEKVTE